jgi:hypothetical protein
MPKYCTQEHAMNEQLVADRIARAWSLDALTRRPELDPIDFTAIRDGRRVGFVEIKCRSRFFFPLWLKLHTAQHARAVDVATGLPVLIVLFNQEWDRAYWIRPAKLWKWTDEPNPRPRAEIVRAGRTDRNDPHDITNNVLINESDLNEIGKGSRC